MGWSDTLRELRISRGWSQVELVRRLALLGCKVSEKAPSKWEHGVSEPSIKQFLALCAVYEIRDVLEAFCGQAGELAALNEEGRRRVREYIRLLGRDESFAREQEKASLRRMIPLYDLPVSAGTGQFLDSSEYTLIEVDEAVPLHATFAVRVRGTVWNPNLQMVRSYTSSRSRRWNAARSASSSSTGMRTASSTEVRRRICSARSILPTRPSDLGNTRRFAFWAKLSDKARGAG